MAKDASDSVRKFKRVLSSLVTLKRTNASSADDIIRQYKEFWGVTVDENKAEFQNFDPFRSDNRDRVDCFLSKYMTQTEEYKSLWNLVSMVLCLSHGQATAERGFSINKEIEVENLQNENYVSQRLIFDHISSVGGVANVNISKSMIVAAAGARSKYMHHLDEQKRMKTSAEKQNKRKSLLGEIE